MCWCNSLGFGEDDSRGQQQAGDRHLHWRWQCHASRRLRLDVKREDCATQILRGQLGGQLRTIGPAFDSRKLFSLGQLFLIEVVDALGGYWTDVQFLWSHTLWQSELFAASTPNLHKEDLDIWAV